MLAFDEVWPADLPALRPLRLELRRPCRTRVAAATDAGRGPAGRYGDKGDGRGGGRDGGPEGYGGPVFLMPMHREGKGVQGRCGVFSSHCRTYIFVVMVGGAERLELVGVFRGRPWMFCWSGVSRPLQFSGVGMFP